jgi:8-oxo-dGTP diphosphatase
MTTADAVALIVLDSDKILLERRGLHKEAFSGFVVVPGGQVEDGETIEEACQRELMEELEEEGELLLRYSNK